MKTRIITALSVILLIGIVIFTLITNSNIKNLEDSRDSRMDVYEATKIWVMDDVRAYLQVRDTDTYRNVKDRVHMQSEIKDILFGETYNSALFPGYTDVSFVDAQYSFEEEDGTFIVYLLANLSKGDETKSINFLVYIHNNKIYDLIAY